MARVNPLGARGNCARESSRRMRAEPSRSAPHEVLLCGRPTAHRGLLWCGPIRTLGAPFHRAFAPCEGVVHTKDGVSVFHRKGGTRFGGCLPYPDSVRPLGEASTPLR
eukprot:327344-Chlamydomonas_euryale.AAC.1